MSAFRVYAADECGRDGYPAAWHEVLKHQVRAEADHRCVRCGHPYSKGAGEWSPCDERCTHGAPARMRHENCAWQHILVGEPFHAGRQLIYDRRPGCACVDPGSGAVLGPLRLEAHWRILTVHHLDGNKANCRWWNLAALCQRCHLTIQGKVQMARVWPWEHSEWFQPYVAGFYAATYLGEDLTRGEVDARLDELLDLERAA